MMEIENLPIDSILADPANPRLHPPRSVEVVKASIARFGFRQPLVVNRKTARLEAGHARLEAAKQLGMDTVPCLVVEDDEVTASAYQIADNRSQEHSVWDQPALLSALDALHAEDALDEAVGWGMEELDRLRAEVEAGTGIAVAGDGEWQGMPEFVQDDLGAWKTIQVHFASAEDYRLFAQAIGQSLTEKTRSIWYPPAPIGRYADKRYTSDES